MKLELNVSLTRRVGIGDNDFFEARCALRCEVDRDALTASVLDDALVEFRRKCDYSVRQQLLNSPDRSVRLQAETPEERERREVLEKTESQARWVQRDLAAVGNDYERARHKRDDAISGKNEGPFYPDMETYVDALQADIAKLADTHSKLTRRWEAMRRRYEAAGGDWDAMIERLELDTDDTPF